MSIAAAGGIQRILAAMKKHEKTQAAVAEHGCGALGNLAFNADNQVKIVEAGLASSKMPPCFETCVGSAAAADS